MSGFFGVASKENCVLDVFFGVDYHSHLGTRRGGMAIHGEKGFARAIHNIENSPFRTKFEKDIEEFDGNLGIGCISDNEAQPLLVKSHLGSFAITTVGRINNLEELQSLCFERGVTHFLEMSTGQRTDLRLPPDRDAPQRPACSMPARTCHQDPGPLQNTDRFHQLHPQDSYRNRAERPVY